LVKLLTTALYQLLAIVGESPVTFGAVDGRGERWI